MTFDFTVSGITILIISLIILWIIVSIPVWIAAKTVTRGKAKFTEALFATLAGQAFYYVVILFADWVLTELIGSTAFILGYVLANLVWIWVFKKSFRTGWTKAILIAVLAWILFFVLTMITRILLGVPYPSPFFSPPLIKMP